MAAIESTSVVFVVDSDPFARESLEQLVKSMHGECKFFARGRTFLHEFDGSRPGCVILDVHLPDMDGDRVLSELSIRNPLPPVIMVSGRTDIKIVVCAMKGGAVDFLEKPYVLCDLRRSLERAIILDARNRACYGICRELQSQLSQLSAQEREVLDMIVADKPIKAIASKLGVSPRTVHARRASLMNKMQAENRVDLIRLALASARWHPFQTPFDATSLPMPALAGKTGNHAVSAAAAEGESETLRIRC